MYYTAIKLFISVKKHAYDRLHLRHANVKRHLAFDLPNEALGTQWRACTTLVSAHDDFKITKKLKAGRHVRLSRLKSSHNESKNHCMICRL